LNGALYNLSLPNGPVPIRFIRNRKAKKYILRVTSAGVARVTIPRGGSEKFGWEFAMKHREWMERQIHSTGKDWEDGTKVWWRGEPLPLRETAREDGTLEVWLGPNRLEGRMENGIRAAVEIHLRALAGPELTARTVELAAQHRIEIKRVVVRDQRTRWGSCSIRRTISLNWRLIQTPELVRDYIIVHELMHLREMNHSRRFWAHVEEAFPDYVAAEKWLRKHGRLVRG
jgi:predicted metal-dependent hydrolase